ncbi:MAG: LysR family transcriptional regulator [Oceanospirillaceae bacterium]
MNIKQLKLFHEIMITGKISQAAQRLSFSQPAASKMLLALEHLIGYQLFFRSKGRLNPTPEAIYLHRETLTVLQSMTRLEHSFEKAKHGQLGKLKIASIFSAAHSLLPTLTSTFVKQFPELALSLQVLGSSDICEGVASGQFEIGLIDKDYAKGHYDEIAFNLPCFCAVHINHQAAQLPVVSAEDFASEEWITFSPNADLYQTQKAQYNDIGQAFNPRIEVNGSLNALAFVEQQCGVTLIDAINLQHIRTIESRKDIIYKPFEPQIYEPIKLISVNSRPLSAAGKLLKTKINEALVELCST